MVLNFKRNWTNEVQKPIELELTEVQEQYLDLLDYEKKDLYIIKIRNKNIYKIGISNNPYNRLLSLQTSNPYELQLLFIIKKGSFFEGFLHSLFEEKRMNGEWFRLDDNDLFYGLLSYIGYYLDYSKLNLLSKERLKLITRVNQLEEQVIELKEEKEALLEDLVGDYIAPVPPDVEYKRKLEDMRKRGKNYIRKHVVRKNE